MNVDQSLLHLGFSAIEIQIYRFLLEKESATSSELQECINGPSLQILAAIESLHKKEVIRSVTKNDEMYFYAESPMVIIRQLEKKQEMQANALALLKKQKGELEGIMRDEKPVVRFYEGKKGLLTMLDEFNGADHKVDPRILFNPNDVNEVFSRAEKEKQRVARVSKNISTRAIYCDSSNQLQTNELSKMKRVNVSDYKFTSDVTIFNNKVMLASLHSQVRGILIEDEKIAETLRALFDLAYKQAEEEERLFLQSNADNK